MDQPPEGESFWNIDSRLRLRFAFIFIIVFIISTIGFCVRMSFRRGLNVIAFPYFEENFIDGLLYVIPIWAELAITNLIDIALFAFAITFLFQEGERAMQYSRERVKAMEQRKVLDQIKEDYPEIDIEKYRDWKPTPFWRRWWKWWARRKQ